MRGIVIPLGAVEVRHGYSLDHLHRIARRAVSSSLRTAMDYADRLDAAWHAIVEHLYDSEQLPSSLELIQVGRLAIEDLVRDRCRAHGYRRRNVYAGRGSAPHFQRYWWLATQRAAAPEGRIVEREALRQIWPRLSATHRQVLLALATHGDYQLAAVSLGKTYGTYCVHVANARKAFLRLWHEGEAPSRTWGTDRRVGRRADGPTRQRRHSAALNLRRRSTARRVSAQAGEGGEGR
jgi:hypothetical protein